MIRSLFVLFALLLAFAGPARAESELVYALSAAGTAHTDSTDETVLASYALPANHFQAGKVYHLHAAAIAVDQNSTDTLTVNVRVGPTTLTGTIVATTGAVDAADNDKVIVDIYLTVRNVGSASIVIVSGVGTVVGAEGTATARAVFESLSLDSTVAQNIELTADWSVAHADNEVRADAFLLVEQT